jgi:prenylcysteine oxidase / farnesylcysteine lyase
VDVFDNPNYPVELGASIFVKVNAILWDAVHDFKLNLTDVRGEIADTLGVWDGERFVYRNTEGWFWWNMAKLIWRYGLSPIRTQSLMKSTVGSFLNLYKWPFFPFDSLSAVAVDLELNRVTAATGAEFLSANGISEKFGREIVQASTRVNYAQNLPLIHGLETMVCMAADGAMAVADGNWRIFAAMLAASDSQLKLETSVCSITRTDEGTYEISFTSNGDDRKGLSIFDDVIIAGPLQESRITITPPFEHRPDEIPYVTLHVTLFASPHPISPSYFGLKTESPPTTILTTLTEGLDLGQRRDGIGSHNFWSISSVRKVPTKEPGGNEHTVYKIFSAERLTAAFLSEILGLKGQDSLQNKTIEDISLRDISWYHEKIWHPYPYLYPRQTFEEIRLAENLWYTSGIESFISTMETSALMGRNVAALIANTWNKEYGLGKAISWIDYTKRQTRETYEL